MGAAKWSVVAICTSAYKISQGTFATQCTAALVSLHFRLEIGNRRRTASTRRPTYTPILVREPFDTTPLGRSMATFRTLRWRAPANEPVSYNKCHNRDYIHCNLPRGKICKQWTLNISRYPVPASYIQYMFYAKVRVWWCKGHSK